MVHTEKLGNNYNREVERKRKKYYADQVDDKAILKILTTIRGALDPAKQSAPTKEETPKPKKQETVSNDDLF